MGAQSTDTAQGLCPILKSIVALEFVASDISEGNRQQTREHETESRVEREMTRQVGSNSGRKMDFSLALDSFVQSPFPPVSPPTRTPVSSSCKYKLKTELPDA